MVTALLNFLVLFIVEITVIYLALGSFLIKLNGLNVILHVVYSCIISIFVAGILSLLMIGLVVDTDMNIIPVLFMIANSIPLLYITAMGSGSQLIEDVIFSNPNYYDASKYVGALFGIACACILILCIYYVVKAWIMFNRKDF